MEFLNRIQLRGIVGDLRTTEPAGIKTCRVQLATNSIHMTGKGDVVVETTWHTVILYNAPGMPDFGRIERGTRMEITGRIRHLHCTGPDGTPLSSYEVIAHDVRLLDGNEPMEYEKFSI